MVELNRELADSFVCCFHGDLNRVILREMLLMHPAVELVEVPLLPFYVREKLLHRLMVEAFAVHWAPPSAF